MRNAGLDDSSWIKTSRRNNTLRYADDMTLTAESEEELKNLLWGWKRRVKNTGLKLNIQKMKIMASSPMTSWQIEEEKVETDTFYFAGLQNHCG